MKLRIIFFIILATTISACNLTLAEDVTPPPGYIPPTPMPTLVLVPPQTPNIANGETIYFEKCAACHGDTGLGDGAQGIQLGVTVPAFALPEIARPASPSGWYTIVTRGKIERFMPPFVSLNDQERWDVVAYIMSLHTSKDEIEKGKDIFETKCPNCSTDYFKDQGKMSGLSMVALARIIRLGNEEIQPFGEDLSDEDMWAVAEYLRSLTYDSTTPASTAAQDQPTVVPATQTPFPADAITPSGDVTPAGTEQVQVTNEVLPGFGSLSGTVENKTGESLPENLVITLRGFEHDFQDPTAGTFEVVTMEGTTTDDGSFRFENVEIPEGRIFLVEVTYKGIDHTSDFLIVDAGQTSLKLPTLVLRDVTTDTSGLVVDELDIFLTTNPDEEFYEFLALYSFRNTGDTIVSVELGDSQELPFLKFPDGAEGIGYEALQDSAPFTSTVDGFAMSPNEAPYGIIAFSSVSIEENFIISQPLVLSVSIARIFVPDGMRVEGNGITQDGPQDVQGEIYQSYSASDLKAGDILSLTISGAPNFAPPSINESTKSANSSLLIGAGGLGIALILAGMWMYLRDRNQSNDEDEDDGEFDSKEDVMDAIIALDELHRVKKISQEAYHKRRGELKEILKEMV